MADGSAVLGSSAGWILVAILGIVWVCLGVYWGRKAKSLDGFMVAGRNVGLALGTATAVATWITSNTTMLAPQFALELGVWGILAYSTASFGLFMFAPLAHRIRRLMPRGYTSVEFIRLRYGRTASVVFLVISLVYSMTWMVSMGMAAGILLEALAGIPYRYGMSVVLLVCVLYTLFGGLYAVIGTDFIQSTIILIGLVVVAVTVLMHVPIAEVHANLETKRPALLNVLFPAAIMAVFNNMLFGIGEVFHSNVWWSRAFAMREGVGTRAYLMAGVLWLPIPAVAGFLGLAAPALGINVTRPDVVGPVVAASVLGYAGAILVFIVVFCSLASSIDSLLAATGDVVTTEIVEPLFMPGASEVRLRRVAATVIVLLGGLTWAICMPKIGTLAAVFFFAGPLVGSTIWPIVAGLYRESVNPTGAVLAMVLGSGIGLVAYFEIGWYAASLVGAGVSFLITVVSTLVFPATFRWQTLRRDSAEVPA